MTVNGRELSGLRILVTGASSGIGAVTARLLAENGAKVAVHYHTHVKEADAVVEAIRTAGCDAESFRADLTDHAEREKLLPSVFEKLGGLDALVNNAGTPQTQRSFLELTESDWEKTLTLNAQAPFFLARDAFAYMMDHGGGRIVNVSSIGVKYGGSAQTMHYAASKAALETITLGLSRAGAQYNILVNAVRAGVIDTPFWAAKSHEEFESRVKLIPLGRPGKPNDVAEMILFLLSAKAGFITGQIIAVSGGD